MAPCLSSYFKPIFNEPIRCLVPCAIDQDPYFRCIRDVSNQLKHPKPSLILAKFLPSLEGTSKMSSNQNNILLSDTKETIQNIVKRKLYTGGRETLKLHRELGGNIDVDIPYQYLYFFLENDQELEKIKNDYTKGLLLSSEIKNILSDVLINFISDHQNKINKITDDDIKYFYSLDKFNE